VSAIGTDFPPATVLPGAAGRTLSASSRAAPTARTMAQACGKHHAAPASGRRNQQLAHQPRAMDRQGTSAGSPSEWEFAKAPASPRERTRTPTSARRGDRAADRLIGSFAASRPPSRAGYKWIYQAGTTLRRLPQGILPGLRRLRADPLSGVPLSLARQPCGDDYLEAPPLSGLPRHRGPPQTFRTRMSRPPAAQAIAPARCSADHGHLDLPRDERRPSSGGPPALRWWWTAGSSGEVRLRGGASAVGDIFGVVDRTWRPGKLPPRTPADRARTCTVLSSRCEDSPVGRTASSFSTGWAATGRFSSSHHLSWVNVGLTLATTPEEVYLALVEATLRTRVIVDAFERGLRSPSSAFAGGSSRNRLLMHISAECWRRPVRRSPPRIGPGGRARRSMPLSCLPWLHADFGLRVCRDGPGSTGGLCPRPGPCRRYDELFLSLPALHDYLPPNGMGWQRVAARLRTRRTEPPPHERSPPPSSRRARSISARCTPNSSGTGCRMEPLEPSPDVSSRATPDGYQAERHLILRADPGIHDRLRLDGTVIEGDFSPSSDTAAHSYV